MDVIRELRKKMDKDATDHLKTLRDRCNYRLADLIGRGKTYTEEKGIAYYDWVEAFNTIGIKVFWDHGWAEVAVSHKYRFLGRVYTASEVRLRSTEALYKALIAHEEATGQRLVVEDVA